MFVLFLNLNFDYMKKKCYLPVLMVLCVLISLIAKAQSSGPYAFVDGLFRYTTVSTKDGSAKHTKVSQNELSIGASMGLGYIVCPNNDGQGMSVDVGFVIGTKNNSYKSISSMSDTKEKMLGAEVTLGYHKIVIPRLYYVPKLSIGFTNVAPSQYVEGYHQWYTGEKTNSIGAGLNLLSFEFKSKDTPFAVRFSMGGITYLHTTAKSASNPVHALDFDLNSFSTAIIYYL